MTSYVILSIFVVIPFVTHHRTFDLANGSAAAALIIGTSCALITLAVQSWSEAIAAFFLSSFLGFAVASIVGLAFRWWGSDERRQFHVDRKDLPPSERRVSVGAIGAVLIPLFFFAFEAAAALQTGAWRTIPTKALLGFLAFFIIGAAALVGIYLRRGGRK
jgi:ABC-type amino acid transport system permease subunit